MGKWCYNLNSITKNISWGKVSLCLDGGEAVKRANCILLCCLLLATSLFGCAKKQSGADVLPAGSGELECLEYSSYSGVFPEDGSYRSVENVAAMLIRNGTGQYLDRAVVKCNIAGQEGVFEVTGIPPGGTVWVMEKTGMTVAEGDTFAAVNTGEYSFRADAVMDTDKVSVTARNGKLHVTNESDKPLPELCLYYKDKHSDGNYFGGITYRKECGTLQPGQTVKVEAPHFTKDSQIVRYSWNDS